MQIFFLVLETVGVVSFAVSGAIAAIDKEIDLFGVLFLSLSTAFGGGILRDVLIGRTPAFFSAYFHIACGAAAALLVFLTAALLKKRYVVREALIGRINNYFDAVGLGIFAVTGAKTCMSAGHTSALVVISLGMITGVGGGMVRDLCLKEIPFVLRKHVYAVAALAGAALYYVTLCVAHIPEYAALSLGIIAVVAIRVLATKFKLNIPKAIIFEEKKQV
jgi:uncharacterized membrane protein YeiH